MEFFDGQKSRKLEWYVVQIMANEFKTYFDQDKIVFCWFISSKECISGQEHEQYWFWYWLSLNLQLL